MKHAHDAYTISDLCGTGSRSLLLRNRFVHTTCRIHRVEICESSHCLNLHLKIPDVVSGFLKKGINPHFPATGNNPLQTPESPHVNGAMIMAAACFKINNITINATRRGRSHPPRQRYDTASTRGRFLHLLFFTHEAEVQSSSPGRALVPGSSQAHVCC